MKIKRLFALLLCVCLAACAASCSAPVPDASGAPSAAQTPAPSAAQSPATPEPSDAPSGSEDTVLFTDSAGRTVEVPAEINSVAPSGAMAQLVLYTACPDKLAGIANDFSDDAKKYIDEKYWSLPKFGQFYGKNANLNMEALVAAAPDVVIDIGEAKETVKEDMDAIQEQIGIPVLFIEATPDTMSDTYTTLGKLLGNEEHMATLAEYCAATVKDAEKNSAAIPDDQRVRVYMATGDAGLNTNAAGGFQSAVIETAGGINVADVDEVGPYGGSEISFEQLLEWQPDVILADSGALYDLITTDDAWQELTAVKAGKVWKIPTVPYNFMGNPPSVNRIIGVRWLGNLLYPDQYGYDIESEVKTFYREFYSIDLSDEQLGEIMSHAAK